MFTIEFWQGTTERVVATFAATLAAVLTASGTGLLDTDFAGAVSAAGMAALLSLLKALAAASPLVPGDGPSLVQAEQVVETNERGDHLPHFDDDPDATTGYDAEPVEDELVEE